MTRSQLGLFGHGNTALEGLTSLDDLPVDADLVALAARVSPLVRFGTTSWTFRGWGDVVYRREYRSDRQFTQYSLGEYARHPLMRTVCIDRAFYKPLNDDDLALYAAQLPPGFRCVSKVWNELSTLVFPNHPRWGERASAVNTQFLDIDILRDQVLAPLSRSFQGHCGPLLVEVSALPRPPSTLERNRFYTALAKLLAWRPDDLDIAVELRERALFTPRYLRVLREGGAAHVYNFWSRMPTIGEQLAIPGTLTASFAVARLMLPPGHSYKELQDRYKPFDRICAPQLEMRTDIDQLVRITSQRNVPVFILVNNKVEGSSPLTIRALAERIAR